MEGQDVKKKSLPVNVRDLRLYGGAAARV